MRISNISGFKLRLLIGNKSDEEPTATCNLDIDETVVLDIDAFDSLVVCKFKEE